MPAKKPEQTIGTRIVQARFQLAAKQGRVVTQAAVAEALGVSAPTVSQWEADRIRPTIDGVQRLARYLGVSPGWLAFGELTDMAQLIDPTTDRRLTEEEIQRARDVVAQARKEKNGGKRRA